MQDYIGHTARKTAGCTVVSYYLILDTKTDNE